MNDQLQGKLVDILSSMQSAAKATGDFAMQQLPDIAQSYIAYGRVSAISYTIVYAIIVIASTLTFWWNWVNFKQDTFYSFKAREPWQIGILMITGAIAGLFSLIMFCSINDLIMVWVAPKVWLLKEVAHMIKG